jgi:hypothetical protein
MTSSIQPNIKCDGLILNIRDDPVSSLIIPNQTHPKPLSRGRNKRNFVRAAPVFLGLVIVARSAVKSLGSSRSPSLYSLSSPYHNHFLPSLHQSLDTTVAFIPPPPPVHSCIPPPSPRCHLHPSIIPSPNVVVWPIRCSIPFASPLPVVMSSGQYMAYSSSPSTILQSPCIFDLHAPGCCCGAVKVRSVPLFCTCFEVHILVNFVLLTQKVCSNNHKDITQAIIASVHV